MFPDLLPPSGLHVLRVEESEVELRWDQADTNQNLISGFAITYAPIGRSPRKTDFLERQHSTYVLQGLSPGQLYNISTYSIKRNSNSNDISQPATALIRTSESPCFYISFRGINKNTLNLFSGVSGLKIGNWFIHFNWLKILQKGELFIQVHFLCIIVETSMKPYQQVNKYMFVCFLFATFTYLNVHNQQV